MDKMDDTVKQPTDLSESFCESARQLRAPFILNELKIYGIEIRAIKEPKKSKYLDTGEEQLSDIIFGENLSKSKCKSVEGVAISNFCDAAINYLDNYINEEGLFRKSGSAKRQHQMKQQIRSGRDLQSVFNELSHDDVAALVKQYLRNLAEPLLTRRLQHHFLRVCLLPPNVQCRVLQLLIFLLPLNHAGTLYHLIKFLIKVASKCPVNKMSITNLALVIAPNLFSFDLQEVKEVTHHQPDLVKLLLEYFPAVFKVPSVMQISTPKKSIISKVKQLSEKLTPKRKRKASPASPDLLRKVRKAEASVLLSPKHQTPTFHNSANVKFTTDSIRFTATPAAQHMGSVKGKGGSSCSKIGRWVRRRQMLRSVLCTSAQVYDADSEYAPLATPVKAAGIVTPWKTPVTRGEDHVPQSVDTPVISEDSKFASIHEKVDVPQSPVLLVSKCTAKDSPVRTPTSLSRHGSITQKSEALSDSSDSKDQCRLSGAEQRHSVLRCESTNTDTDVIHRTSRLSGDAQSARGTSESRESVKTICDVVNSVSAPPGEMCAKSTPQVLSSLPSSVQSSRSRLVCCSEDKENVKPTAASSSSGGAEIVACNSPSVLRSVHKVVTGDLTVKATPARGTLSVSSPRLAGKPTIESIRRCESAVAFTPPPTPRSIEELKLELRYHEERIHKLRAVIMSKQNNNVCDGLLAPSSVAAGTTSSPLSAQVIPASSDNHSDIDATNPCKTCSRDSTQSMATATSDDAALEDTPQSASVANCDVNASSREDSAVDEDATSVSCTAVDSHTQNESPVHYDSADVHSASQSPNTMDTTNISLPRDAAINCS